MKNLFNEIKKRKVWKWLTVYLSTSVTVIGVVHLLSIRYELPPTLFNVLLTVLVFGIVSVIITAWFHGEAGRQKFTIKEGVLHSLVLLLLAVSVYFVIRSEPVRLLPENIRTIAVLPFTNLNSNEENEFFSDGITEDIITQLSKLSELNVISRTSVMKYKNTKKGIKEIAKELGAGSILEGSVRLIGNKVRIVGQLIDANKDKHLWANTYDRELKDIFSIQSEIAQKIADELAARLTPLEEKLISTEPTHNMDAYTLYLKGKYFYNRYTEEDNEKAIKLFKKALQIDSNYAMALAGLADAYNQKVAKYWSKNEWYDSAIVLSKKALEINPDLPEAYKSLATAYDGLEKNDVAAIYYKKAIRLNPNYTSAIMNYGQIKLFNGEYDKAYFWIRKANILAPDNIFGIITRSYIYRYLYCNDLAVLWAKKAVELEPQNIFALTNLGDVYLNAGNYTEAQNVFRKIISINDKWILGWFLGARLEAALGNYKLAKEYTEKYMNIAQSSPEYFYGYFLMKLGKYNEGMEIIKREKKSYIDYIHNNPDATLLDLIALSEIHAILNEREDAFKNWSSAIDKGFTEISRTVYYPFLDTLKTDSRYNLMIGRMQNRVDSLKNLIRKTYPDNDICE